MFLGYLKEVILSIRFLFACIYMYIYVYTHTHTPIYTYIHIVYESISVCCISMYILYLFMANSIKYEHIIK